jgi:quinol monooxygenase YgiN
LVSSLAERLEMSEIAVVARLTAGQGKEDRVEGALRGLIELSQGEEGCLLYALLRDTVDPRGFCFVERWASREALDAHLEAPHLHEAFSEIAELFDGDVEMSLYEGLPIGDPVKGSLPGNTAKAT